MTISAEVNDGIGKLTIDRPAKLNAFTPGMYDELATVLNDWNEDDRVAVILAAGAGGNFSSGNDLGEFLAAGSAAALGQRIHSSPQARAVAALLDLEKPVVVAVEGCAIGFAATMLLHFDWIVMAEDAYLEFPFLKLGVVPEAGSSQLLARRVGDLVARRLLLDPRRIAAPEALGLALATECCASGAAMDKALQVAARLAGRSPYALRETRKLLQGDREQLKQAVAEEFSAFAACLQSDYTRAVLAAMTAGK